MTPEERLAHYRSMVPAEGWSEADDDQPAEASQGPVRHSRTRRPDRRRNAVVGGRPRPLLSIAVMGLLIGGTGYLGYWGQHAGDIVLSDDFEILHGVASNVEHHSITRRLREHRWVTFELNGRPFSVDDAIDQYDRLARSLDMGSSLAIEINPEFERARWYRIPGAALNAWSIRTGRGWLVTRREAIAIEQAKLSEFANSSMFIGYVSCVVFAMTLPIGLSRRSFGSTPDRVDLSGHQRTATWLNVLRVLVGG